MNKRIKRKWINALRSGKYQQTTGALREMKADGKTGFCCLGVLCNIHAQEHPEIARNQLYAGSYLGNTGSLPEAVMDWAGMEDEEGFFKTKKGRSKTLVELNDDKGKSFKHIANYIERFF